MMIQKANLRNFDVILFLTTLLLILIGGMMIYSSYDVPLAREGGLLESAAARQMLVGAAGMILSILLAITDYRFLISLHHWLYLLALALLGLTLIAGHTSFGAQSWLGTETLRLQPSELSKVLLIVVLARVLGQEQEALESPKPFLTSASLIAPAVVLIYLQPDLGTALVLLATWVGMAFFAGVRWRHMFLLAGAAIVGSPFVWFRLKGYMRERILTFLFPGQDPSGISYNINQALISIGSGGFWGKGFLHGTQSQLYFLRVRHTDFIFSVLAEEFGFVGSALLLALFALLIARLIRIALSAPDAYGRLIAAGMATVLVIQIFINLGMNANLLPVTGLPLPLVSYGGSSLLTTLMGLGLAQSVALRRKGPESESLL